MTKIIAFGHKKRVGKDTCAKMLDTVLRANGVSSKRVSFADKLKNQCHELYGWSGLKRGIYYESPEGELIKETSLPEIGKSPRQIWIEFGNKCREIYEDTWIRAALQDTGHDIKIIKDLRFTNEAKRVLDAGGILVRINRTLAPIGTDLAEVDLDRWPTWHYTINNNSTFEDLMTEIIKIAKNEEFIP